MKKDLGEIIEVVQKERSQVVDILRVILKTDESDEMMSNLAVMSMIQVNMRNAGECPGEWLYCEINEIKNYVSGSGFELVPNMLKGLFVKTASYLTSQDIIKEFGEGVFEKSVEIMSDVEKKSVVGSKEKEISVKSLTPEEEKVRKAEVKIKAYIAEHRIDKRSKSGFPEIGLPVTSKVVNKMRICPCPVEGCTKAFSGPRTCDTHINRHLGYEYGPCHTCGYTNASCDSYDKHKCFAGLKMGGKKPPSRGPCVQKRKRGDGTD